jgi:hypothetical protein
MKRILLLLVSLSFLLSCANKQCCQSSESNPTSPTSPTSTSILAAGWTINIVGTVTLQGGTPGPANGVIQATFVPNGPPQGIGPVPCTLDWGDLDISVQGPACFGAGDDVGSLSWTGEVASTSAIFLLAGVEQNPIPNGSSIDFLYVEAAGESQLPVAITGAGTVSAGTVSGTWQCTTQAMSPYYCTGNGTFSGTQQ